MLSCMLGRIGKTYPRVSIAEEARVTAARSGALRYGVMGGLIAVLSALGVVGWLLLR